MIIYDYNRKVILGYVDNFGPIFEGDAYCIKHQELLTPGLDNTLSCGFCEWGDN